MFNEARILCIDPGTNHTGYSVLDLNNSGELRCIYARTLDTSPLVRIDGVTTNLHSDRFSKIRILGNELLHLLRIFRPHVVISESPYMGRFPQSFAALVEVLLMFRDVIFQFDPALPFETIDPSSVKKSMGVSGKSGDKDLMSTALQKENIQYLSGINSKEFDEHTVDSICVGVHYIKRHFGDYYV